MKIIKCESCGKPIKVGDKVNRAKCEECKEKSVIARKISKDSEYRIISPRYCKVCGKEFSYDWRKDWETRKNTEAEFCSNSCARKYSCQHSFQKYENSLKELKCTSCGKICKVDFHTPFKSFLCEDCKRKKDDYKKSKFSTGKFCKVCGKTISVNNKTGLCKGCLETSKEGKQILSDIAKERIKKGFTKPWIPRNVVSYPEQYWRNVLDKAGIKYKTNYKVLSYFLDFFIEKNGVKIDLEIDGGQHNYPENLKHDTIRNYEIGKLGYKVYRVAWKNVKIMETKVKEFFKWYNSL